jgi:hypothetical protein
MQISTALFLQTQGASQEKKVSKEAVAKVLSQNLEPPSAETTQSHSVKEVVTQLMGTLASEAKSKGAVLEFLKQSPLFKNLGHFQSDVKSLISLLKWDSSFEKPLLLLQNFQKNIETIDPKLLKTQVQNSGIFFESTLAKSVTKEHVSTLLKSLVIELKEHLAQTQKSPAFTKEITPLLERLSEPKILSEAELQRTLKDTLQLFRHSMKEHLFFEPTAQLKTSYALTQKLETLLQTLPLLASKKENTTESLHVIQKITAEIKEHLAQTPALAKEIAPLLQRLSEPKALLAAELQTTVKATLELLRHRLDGQQTFALTQKLETLLHTLLPSTSKMENLTEPLHVMPKKITELVNTLKAELIKNAPLEMVADIVPMMEALLQNPHVTGTQILLAKTNDLSLEEQLLLLTNRLKQEIARLEPQTPKLATFMEKSVQIEQKILSILKPEVFLSPEVMQKLSINPSDSQILGDIKGVLTSLSDKLVASSNPNATNAQETTQKLLTQIEYHQLVSYVGSATHLYIPFTWEGLKEGSMMMKQTKEDAFHCQIDLDLEQYGKLNMMLLLSGENTIDMTIATQKSELRDKVSEHLSDLKKALNEVGIITQSVRIMEYKEESVKKKEYFSDDTLNFGINITI